MSTINKQLSGRVAIRIWYTIILVAILFLLILILGGSFGSRRSLLINEVMTSNRCTITDEDGDYPDWLEIFNPGRHAVSLKGFWLTDDTAEPFKWPFPDITIEPGQYLVVFASGKDRRDPTGDFLHTNFRLSASGSTLMLIDPEASISDSITTTEMLSNISYGRRADNHRQWVYYLDATPGASNKTTGYLQVTDMPWAKSRPVLINEFLTANRTSLPDEDGDLSDWIELFNPGNEPVDLSGFWLSDKVDNPFKWRFPAVTIEPDQYLLVFASGKNRPDPNGPYLHTNFQLNDLDDTLILSKPTGEIVDMIEIRNMERDVSYGRDIDNPDNWLYYPRPTPGEANYTQGFEKFSGTPVPNLVISEIMAVNRSTIRDEDGEYSDWIEIYNSDSFTVNLAGYGISDQEDNPFRWTFPELEIDPGEYLLLFASGKDRRYPDSTFLHTNFKIQATGETVVLYHPSGILVDIMPSGKLQPDQSTGRLPGNYDNRFYFTAATPGLPNSEPFYYGYASPPRLSHQGGYYNRPFNLEIETAENDAVIRYTLDGSEPSGNSALYDKPIPIDQTTVLRVRTFSEKRLPSPIVNRTFLFNTVHNLPVVSVFTDPKNLWDPVEGIYVKGYHASSEFPFRGANFWKDMEKPIHFEFYEADGTLGFSFDGGIKIGGQYSRGMDQKIFNVFARNIYGYNQIRYPLFPRKELTHFKALTLRTSGQDAIYSKIRDIMMSSLLEDTGLDFQDHRQAVLYLNGKYWGIYNIRERINRYFVADNHGLDPDYIDLLQANWTVRAGSNEHYIALREFVRTHNLAVEENYEYVKTQMDITNYIDALIAQIYFAQTDQGNIRFWREQSPEGKWRWIVFDFDWCFWPSHLYNNTLAGMTNPAGTGWNQAISTLLTTNLMQNQDFRTEFIDRFAYHLNYTFEPERVVSRIDELALNIEPEMPRQLDRWGGSIDRWYSEVEQLRRFARLRPAIVMEHVRHYFSLTEEEMEIFDGWQSS